MPQDLTVRGHLPDYVVRSLRRDRNGIFSGQVAVPHLVDMNQARVRLEWMNPTVAPKLWGIPVVGVTAELNPPAVWVLFDYQGLDPNGGAPTDDDVTFEIDGSMSEDPIETHPSFLGLLKSKYGWDQNERRFAETIGSSGGGDTALSGEKKAGKANPLFGTDSWLAVGAIYRRTYAARAIPPSAFFGIGTITSRPPDIGQFNMPSLGKRNWLKLAPKIVRTGNAIRISEEWMLSGPNGWLTQIYNAGQLGSSGGDSPGSGLSTGGLTTGSL